MVTETHTSIVYLIDPGPRPPFWQLAFELWGDSDFDSDGDSRSPDDDAWMCLTLSLRGEDRARIDIDPVSLDPLVLEIRGEPEALVQKAAAFLVRVSGGSISDRWTASTP